MDAPGTIDFIQYWSAYQLFKGGQNGYDPTLLLDHERLTGLVDLTPKMFWSPPWTLTLMAPVLELPFDLSAKVWLGVSITLWLLAALVCSVSVPKNRIFSFAACLLCFPAFDVLRLGQTGLLLSAALVGMWVALGRRSYRIAGCCVPILLIKPHLFYLTFVWLIFAMRNRRFWYSTLISFATLIMATELVIPGAIKYWLPTLFFNESGNSATPRVTYFTSTLAGLMRTIAPFPGDHFLLVIIPLVTLVGFGFALYKTQPAALTTFLASIPLSLFTAPYGWFHDASVLLPLHAEIGSSKRCATNTGLLILVLCQIVVYCQVFYYPSYAYAAWYPLGVWGAWIIVRKEQSNPPSSYLY